jgi:glycosyltransferase involved in cell wall biosynthesis
MIGPVEIAGIAAGLKSGFDRLGVESEVVLSHPNLHGYGSHQSPPIPRIWSALGKYHVKAMRRLPRPLTLPTWLMWKCWAVLVWIWALPRFDAFIFIFGHTITNSRLEARLYASLGKRVVMIYCGSDARPPYVDGPTYGHYGPSRTGKFERLAGLLQARIRLHEECGFVCVNSPFTAQFHARPYANWFEIGVARTPGTAAERPADSANRTAAKALRILHSPSDLKAKGTQGIVDIVDTLKREGHAIEFILLNNVSNAVVQAELAQCDFVIDQCWSDTPMAGFAVEAAHHGKAVAVAGYAASQEYRAYLSNNPPPTLFVHPDALEDAVRQLVADVATREALGRRALDFVRGHWSAEKVAGRYLDLLEGRAPAGQFMAPDALNYVHGGGLPEELARETVRTLIAERGARALHLDHNPSLQKAFTDFAGQAGRDSPS